MLRRKTRFALRQEGLRVIGFYAGGLREYVGAYGRAPLHIPLNLEIIQTGSS